MEEKETLEKVVKEKIEPLIVKETKQAIGATVEELNRSLIEKIVTTPFHIIDVDTSLSYRRAKQLFKKKFFMHLIETHYGNISDVAKITGIDRRTIHRVIRDLDIDISRVREHLLNPDHYLRIALDSSVKNVLEQYKPIINPNRLEQIYKNLPRLEEELVAQLPHRDMTYKDAEEEFEKRYFSKILKDNHWNVSLSAKKIGLRYETLHRKIKSLGLTRE